jgi:hypothetical protein
MPRLVADPEAAQQADQERVGNDVMWGFFEVGQPIPAGAQTAPPPTKEEIEKLLAVAPQYGIEVKLPH